AWTTRPYGQPAPNRCACDKTYSMHDGGAVNAGTEESSPTDYRGLCKHTFACLSLRAVVATSTPRRTRLRFGALPKSEAAPPTPGSAPGQVPDGVTRTS